MPYALQLEPRDGFLHAVVTGANTEENVLGYLGEVFRHCQEHQCRRLLIEERLEGPRLGTLEVFKIATRRAAEIFGTLEAIAFVDVNAKGDLMSFAETVSRNRGIPLAVFPTVAEAQGWLAAKTPAAKG